MAGSNPVIKCPKCGTVCSVVQPPSPGGTPPSVFTPPRGFATDTPSTDGGQADNGDPQQQEFYQALTASGTSPPPRQPPKKNNFHFPAKNGSTAHMKHQTPKQERVEIIVKEVPPSRPPGDRTRGSHGSPKPTHKEEHRHAPQHHRR